MDQEVKYLREKRSKETILNYEPLAIIGRGAFGEVRLCKHVTTDEIVAVKKLNKAQMYEKKQLHHTRAERDILVHSDTNFFV